MHKICDERGGRRAGDHHPAHTPRLTNAPSPKQTTLPAKRSKRAHASAVRSVPGLGKIADIPFVTQVLQGVLPSVVLKIFLAILPLILNRCAY